MHVRVEREPAAGPSPGARRPVPTGLVRPPVAALVRTIGNARASRMLMRQPPDAYFASRKVEKLSKEDLLAYLDSPTQPGNRTFLQRVQAAELSAPTLWDEWNGPVFLAELLELIDGPDPEVARQRLVEFYEWVTFFEESSVKQGKSGGASAGQAAASSSSSSSGAASAPASASSTSAYKAPGTTYDDALRSAEAKLRKTYGAHLQKHIFSGEIAADETVTGYHSKAGPVGDISAYGNQTKLDQGTYFQSVWAPKLRTNAKKDGNKGLKKYQSTFFPDGTTTEQVMQAVFVVLARKRMGLGGPVPSWLENPLAGLPLKFIGDDQQMTVFPDMGNSPLREDPPPVDPKVKK